jgi:hypothetical protein
MDAHSNCATAQWAPRFLSLKGGAVVGVEERINNLERRISSMEQNHRRLSDGVELNNKMTKEMYEVFATARVGFQIIEFLGKMAKPAFYIAALSAAVWAYLKTGIWHFRP